MEKQHTKTSKVHIKEQLSVNLYQKPFLCQIKPTRTSSSWLMNSGPVQVQGNIGDNDTILSTIITVKRGGGGSGGVSANSLKYVVMSFPIKLLLYMAHLLVYRSTEIGFEEYIVDFCVLIENFISVL